MADGLPLTADETGLVPLLSRQAQPFEMLRRAAAAHWYGRNEYGMRVLLRYQDCATVQRDPRFTEPGMEMLRAQGITSGAFYEWWESSLFNNEGDRHQRLRSIVSREFTPAAVDRLRPAIRAIVNRTIDRLGCDQGLDLIADFADPIPVMVLAHMAGVPDEDVDQLSRWSRTLGRSFAPFDPIDHIHIEHAIVGLYGLVDELLAQRRLSPGTDLVSTMAEAHEQGQLDIDELRAMVATLLIAAHDTTRSAIGCLATTLLEQRDLIARLVHDSEARPRIIEELLRFNPPVAGGLRKALEDVQLTEGIIGAGEVVMVSGLAANHDPRVFDRPQEVDVDRFAGGVAEIVRPLTFGLGAHYCLGANLARTVLEESLATLFTRHPGLRLATETVPWRSRGFRCPEELWVTDHPTADRA